MTRHPHALTIIDAIATCAALFTVFAAAAVAAAQPRRQSARTLCISSLAEQIKGHAVYAVDFEDSIAAFSWRTGHAESTNPDLRALCMEPGGAAPAAQAIDIIRRRANANIEPIRGWLPNPTFSHLVLQDYLASRVPDELFACPNDQSLLLWQRENGRFFADGAYLPFQPDPKDPAALVWPYSSSYECVPASYDPALSRDIDAAPGNRYVDRRLAQGRTHHEFDVPEASVLGGTRFSDVSSPAMKVAIFEQVARHGGLPRLFADDQATVPLAFFDGSIREQTAAQTNPGWQPRDPASPEPTTVTFAPRPWEIGSRADAVSDPSMGQDWPGRFRWTRGGLKGEDVAAGAPAGP